MSCFINRLQNSSVPGRARVPSSLYKRGRLENLGVTPHVFQDKMEYGQAKVVRMQLKVSAVKLFRYSCPAWNWQYSFMLSWKHDTRSLDHSKGGKILVLQFCHTRSEGCFLYIGGDTLRNLLVENSRNNIVLTQFFL